MPKNFSFYMFASDVDLFGDETLLDDSLDVKQFYGNSYDKWVKTIL
jgi:hypothetical protein